MAFSERIRKLEIEKADGCAVCREPFPPGAYIEVHSATSLHLVLDKKSKDRRYIVTDPPLGHKILRGKSISARVFALWETKDNDAFCLCPVCHDELKRSSLAESKRRITDFSKNAPPPAILEEVTLFNIERRRRMVIDVIVTDIIR